jgi:hypothetical protein
VNWIKELTVHYRGNQSEEQIDTYKAARMGYDAGGWLVVTLDNNRGVFRYPPSNVIKVHEWGER